MKEWMPRLYIVRHAETEWSALGRHTGKTDVPLSEKGEASALLLGGRLRDRKFERVLTSPLVRSRRTAELAGFGAALTEPDLREWEYGAYEGLRTIDIHAEAPRWRAFEDGYPGGETLAEVGLRADRVIKRTRLETGDVLIFGHRDILRVLVARWLGLPALEGRRFQLDTASISILGYDHNLDEPVIWGLNKS